MEQRASLPPLRQSCQRQPGRQVQQHRVPSCQGGTLVPPNSSSGAGKQTQPAELEFGGTVRPYICKTNTTTEETCPHWQPPEGTFFVTYRLYGSIPQNVIQQLKSQYETVIEGIEAAHALPIGEALEKLPLAERQHLLAILEKKKYEEQKRHFARFDNFLDRNLNKPHWLKIPEIAELVAGSIHHFADKHYKLWAYTIMSNHVHVLLTMLPGAPVLWKVLQDSKKYSGRQANQLLGRTGEKFWEHESYDHLVRQGKLNEPGEFYRIQNYILNNPVKAGLLKAWEAWPWTYLHP